MNSTYQVEDPSITFILGGPGSGKGTACERLVRDFKYKHISTGDLIRDEISKKTPEGLQVEQLVANGEMVPDSLIVGLLEKVLRTNPKGKFLVDGFPRGLAQAQMLEQRIGEIKKIINIEASEETLIKRLLGRGLTSGRSDDNQQAIEQRIRVFKENTIPVLEHYRVLGRIHTVDASGDIDTVYQSVQKAIRPRVIFLYGPPCVQKSHIAALLQKQTTYHILNAKSCPLLFREPDEMNKVNILMQYLENTSEPNIIIDYCFETTECWKMFLEQAGEPILVIYFDAQHSDVLERIASIKATEKIKASLVKRLHAFEAQKVQFLPYIKNAEYFMTVSRIESDTGIVKQITRRLRPTIVAGFLDANVQVAEQYIQALEKERGFKTLRMQSLCNEETTRKTQLGHEMLDLQNLGQAFTQEQKCMLCMDPDFIFCPIFLFQLPILVKRLLYSDVKCRNVLLIDFPTNVGEKDFLESEGISIDYVMTFTQPGEPISQDNLNELMLDYYEMGRHILVDRMALDITDTFLTRRSNWGLVIGSEASGKTSIAKMIEKSQKAERLEWETFTTGLKEKLGGDEGALENLTFEQIAVELSRKLKTMTHDDLLLLDSFPYKEEDAQRLIQVVGVPNYVINIALPHEVIIERFRKRNDLEADAELSEEQIEQIEKIQTESEQ